MALQVKIKTNGLQEIARKLGFMREAKDVPKIAGQRIVLGIKQTFDASRDPETGKQWPKLKARVGKPLINTGRLRRSIHFVTRKNGVTIGTNFAFASVHQYGKKEIVPKKAKMLSFMAFGMRVYAKKVSIPQRRFLPETDKGMRRITVGLQEAIDRYMARLDAGK